MLARESLARSGIDVRIIANGAGEGPGGFQICLGWSFQPRVSSHPRIVFQVSTPTI